MQLAIRFHRVTINIQDQVAVTHVDQVFYNPNQWAVEGTYTFPLPPGSAVTSFTLWVDGEPVQAEILDAEQARRRYQEIVSSLRDPALLEYAGQGAAQAQIFPIPPQGERRVELEYTQALTAQDGLVRYSYPLSTEKFSAWPIENISISLDIQSSSSIRAVYSPGHSISIDRQSPNHVRVGYEASQVLPNADFALAYSLGEQPAFHLLSFRDPSDSSETDGYFLLLLAPEPQAPATSLSKDVLIVLDRSGSMEGEKFLQAQEALRYILTHLNTGDRFNLVAFSTSIERYAGGLRPASEAAQAIDWVNRQSTMGSTDIQRALLEAAAMADQERPTYLIFLTDGLPTEGVVDSQKILQDFSASAPTSLRLFAFGVGYDVDTFLLDSLAQQHHGTSSYVPPGQAIDESLSAFYAKISTPVLTDLVLDFGSLAVYDLYPQPLPDLFSGSQIIAVGRYRQGGSSDVTLSGKVNNQEQIFRFENQAFDTHSTPDTFRSAIPRLWATRKIGYLLSQVRLQGPLPETIEQIVRLSIRFGIITPYTSFLVSENLPLGAEEQERISAEQYSQLAGAAAPSYGQEAVEKAQDQSALAGAEAPLAPQGSDAQTVRIIGSRTFVLDGEKWIDTAFDPARQTIIKTAFLSDDYFALAYANPSLAAAFALGQAVIVVSGDSAYEVVGEEDPVAPLEIPPVSGPKETPDANPGDTPPTAPPPTAVAAAPPQPASVCPGAMLAVIMAGITWLLHFRFHSAK